MASMISGRFPRLTVSGYSGKSTTLPTIGWNTAPNIPAIARDRSASSPSCSPRSTEAPGLFGPGPAEPACPFRLAGNDAPQSHSLRRRSPGADCRLVAERSAEGRYGEPSLFAVTLSALTGAAQGRTQNISWGLPSSLFRRAVTAVPAKVQTLILTNMVNTFRA
jgi:hypothetical protein